jgi:hypothetical protein
MTRPITSITLAFSIAFLVLVGCGKTSDSNPAGNSDGPSDDAYDDGVSSSDAGTDALDDSGSTSEAGPDAGCFHGVVQIVTDGCPCIYPCGGACTEAQVGMKCWYGFECPKSTGGLDECTCGPNPTPGPGDLEGEGDAAPVWYGIASRPCDASVE